MAEPLSPEDVRTSLNAHLASKGLEIYEKYGPRIGWKELQCLLVDRSCVRYPCTLEFDAGGLQPGECAHPVANGDRPEDGFTLYIHPFFLTQPNMVSYLVLYQLVLVNYGDFAFAEDAEVFGANALGLSQDAYYRAVCELADQLEGGAPFSCA